jgi:hypothetical protein
MNPVEKSVIEFVAHTKTMEAFVTRYEANRENNIKAEEAKEKALKSSLDKANVLAQNRLVLIGLGVPTLTLLIHLLFDWHPWR